MNFDYKIIVYVFFGLLPSLVWLFYYLQKDLHPEPKKTIVRIFLWGAVITFPVFFVQVGLNELLNMANLPPFYVALVYWFLIISLSEEIFKYLVVKIKIVNSPDFDEPLDIMLYMVIAALGFSALENILYLLTPIGQPGLENIILRTSILSLIRFVGATFLHTLCSALVGYFMAMSFCQFYRRRLMVWSGIALATLLHGIYDFSIMQLEGVYKFAVPCAVIFILAGMVFWAFEHLKQKKSVCNPVFKAVKSN